MNTANSIACVLGWWTATALAITAGVLLAQHYMNHVDEQAKADALTDMRHDDVERILAETFDATDFTDAVYRELGL
jgi:hypothetical protein